MNQFKIGNRVKSVVQGGDYLKLDKEYVVTNIYSRNSVNVDNIPTPFPERWFELVQPTFKAMKFRVNSPEQSKEIQEALFSMGYGWCGYGEEVVYTGYDFLYTEEDGSLGYSDEEFSNQEYILKESTAYSIEKAPVESPVTQQINIDGQALTEQDVRDLIAFKKLMQEQLEKFGGK